MCIGALVTSLAFPFPDPGIACGELEVLRIPRPAPSEVAGY